MLLRNLRTETGRRNSMKRSCGLDFLLGYAAARFTSEAKVIFFIPAVVALYTDGRPRAVQSWKMCAVSVCYRALLLQSAPSKRLNPTTLRFCSLAYLREHCSSEPTLRRFATRLALERFLGAAVGAAVMGSLLRLCPCVGRRTKLGLSSCPQRRG